MHRCKTAARATVGHLFIGDDHGTLRLCLATDLAGAQVVSFSAFCQAIQSMNRWLCSSFKNFSTTKRNTHHVGESTEITFLNF